MGYFKFSASVHNLLFEGVTFQSAGGTFGLCALIFVISALFEKLKSFQSSLLSKPGTGNAYRGSVNALDIHKRTSTGTTQTTDSVEAATTTSTAIADAPTTTATTPTATALDQKLIMMRCAVASLVYMFQFVIAYLLMLIVMEFNANFFIATVLGFGLGHYLFKMPS